MEPPDSPLTRVPGSIALHEAINQASFAKFVCAIRTCKETAVILMKLWLDDISTLELCRDELHYFVQKKSPSIWCVLIRYSSCLRRLNARNWNTSSVISIRLNSSRSCSAPRLASHLHWNVG